LASAAFQKIAVTFHLKLAAFQLRLATGGNDQLKGGNK
jgi:hypothetical protein